MKLPYATTAGVAAALLGMAAAPAKAIPVDVELQLLIDTSGSVSSSEFDQQVGGYVSAFQSTAIHDAIAGGDIGSIAVQTIFWSSADQQAILQADGTTGSDNDWFELTDPSSSNSFAGLLDGVSQPFGGGTAPGSAITFGYPLFEDNGFEGTSLVMDVSGDGEENQGVDTDDASDAAIAAGIDRINGIPIGAEEGDALYTFYNTAVRDGPDSFVIAAADFTAFESAIATKLRTEITGEPANPIPLPASAFLLLAGAGGLGALRLRGRRG